MIPLSTAQQIEDVFGAIVSLGGANRFTLARSAQDGSLLATRRAGNVASRNRSGRTGGLRTRCHTRLGRSSQGRDQEKWSGQGKRLASLLAEMGQSLPCLFLLFNWPASPAWRTGTASLSRPMVPMPLAPTASTQWILAGTAHTIRSGRPAPPASSRPGTASPARPSPRTPHPPSRRPSNAAA